MNDEDAATAEKGQVFAFGHRVGFEEALRLYAWWRDGEQYVGCGRKTLKQAIEAYKDPIEALLDPKSNG